MRNQTAYMRCAPSSSRTRTHLQQTSVSIKATTVPATLFARPKPNTRSRSCPSPSFRPRPAYQLRRLACSVAYLQTSSSFPPPRSERRRRRSARARTPLRCSARKMRFDGRESKRGVTIDGPMGRSKYRGTQGITSMDVVKAEADALKQSNEAPS